MRIVIRTDVAPHIGGGHLMRCLTLADAAARRGHDVHFVVNQGDLAARVGMAGHSLTVLPSERHAPEPAPPHAAWLSAPWPVDAARTAEVVARYSADWLVWDHYGLDARWVTAVRQGRPGLRVLAIDELDDRPLGSDLVCDPAWEGGARLHDAPGHLHGPDFAWLRPEFAALREAALTRRAGVVRRVLILPGMMDAAGLAPLALDALAGTDLTGEVVMGAASHSVDAVRARLAAMPGWSLVLDAQDIAAKMAAADLCVGAMGGTAWERCCLGLPTVAVAVADNQIVNLRALERAGAVLGVPLAAARSGGLGPAIAAARDRAAEIGRAAASLCDGRGADRAVAVLEARLRPVTFDDARLLFEWRDQPHIRAVSHTQASLDWEHHLQWLDRIVARRDGLWCIYEEGGQPLGFVGMTDRGEGRWHWSFYVGAQNALRGTGGRMLAAALRHLAGRRGALWLEAEVLEGNTASAALHRRLGFAQMAAGAPGVLAFRKQL